MKKPLLLILFVLSLGLILKYKDSLTLKKSDLAFDEKAKVVIAKLVKLDGQEPQDVQIRKAYLGLSTIYANKNPEDFISSSTNHLKTILSGLQSEHNQLAKEVAEKILSPNSELRVKDEKARAALISCKKQISEALHQTSIKI